MNYTILIVALAMAIVAGLAVGAPLKDKKGEDVPLFENHGASPRDSLLFAGLVASSPRRRRTPENIIAIRTHRFAGLQEALGQSVVRTNA